MDRDITQAKQDVVSVYMKKQKKANLLLKNDHGNSLGIHFTDSYYSTSSFMSLSVSLIPCVVVLVVLLPCLVVNCALVFSSSTLDTFFFLDMHITRLKGI